MKKKFWLMFLCGLFLMGFSGVVSAESMEGAEANKSLFENKCSYCHSIDRPLSKRKNNDGWKSTVKRMQSKNPIHISNVEAEKIIAYLSYIRNEESTMINKAKDPLNLSELEKKHVPVIQLGTGDTEKKTLTVTVKVGEEEHPMLKEHYIKYIELFIDDKSVGKVDLKPGDKPESKFEIGFPVSGHITAREECNIHGIWDGKIR